MGLSCNSAQICDGPNALAKKSPHKAFPATALVQQVVLIACCEATQASKKSLAVFLLDMKRSQRGQTTKSLESHGSWISRLGERPALQREYGLRDETEDTQSMF